MYLKKSINHHLNENSDNETGGNVHEILLLLFIKRVTELGYKVQ